MLDQNQNNNQNNINQVRAPLPVGNTMPLPDSNVGSQVVSGGVVPQPVSPQPIMNDGFVATPSNSMAPGATVNNISNQNPDVVNQNMNNQPMPEQPPVNTLNQMVSGTNMSQVPIQNSMQPNVGVGPMPNGQNGTMTPPPTNNIMDDSFAEKKKKNPIGIIILILLVFIIGGCAAYYFVLDTPKKVFTTTFDSLYTTAKENSPKSDVMDIAYSLNANIVTEDEDYKVYTDIINNLILKGTTGIDMTKKAFAENMTVNYKSEELLNVNALLDSSNLYLKLNNILDKVIKLELTDEEETENNYNFSISDYEQIQTSIYNALNSSLENAEFTKEIVKLNNQNVKKSTMTINKSFIENIIDKLSQDQNFLTSISNITISDTKEVADALENMKSELEEDIVKVSIYTTILKNEFLKLEIYDDDDSIVVTKGNSQYNFEIISSNTLVYDGYVMYNKVSDITSLSLNLELVEDKTSITLNLTYSVTENTFEAMDTTDAVDYEALTEEDTNEIMTNLFENKAVNSLLEDIGLTDTEDLLTFSGI